MKKKGEGETQWYIIAGILMVLVVAIVIGYVLGINPIKMVTDLFPSFINGGSSSYQGLCRIEKAEWKAGFIPAVYVKGTEDCKGDEVEIEVYKDDFLKKDRNLLTGLKATFDGNYVINKEIKSLEKPSYGNGDYYFTLSIDGVKPLTTKGKVFEKSEVFKYILIKNEK